MKVYLIQNEEGYYKIGVTSRSVEKRIKEMKTSYPLELYKIFEYNTKKGYEVETFLKRIYSYKNVDGEWFSLEKSDVDNFIKICKKYENNLKMLKKMNNPFI